MSHRFLGILSLSVSICMGTALAQTAATNSPAPATSTATPVAFVYVSSTTTGNTNKVYGYAAAADGTLAPTPYSPYSHDVTQMAVNGKYLFAAGNNSTSNNIYTFSIGPHGYLTLADTANMTKFPNSSICASPGALTLDRTGVSLYPVIFESDCSNDAYYSLAIAKSSGALTYLSQTNPTNIGDFVPLIFTGNNKIGYAVTSGMYSQISGFRRESNGSLVDISIDVSYVNGPDGNGYSFQTGSIDATDHLGIALLSDTGVSQIASYTADESNGNLSTKSTYENMPKVAVAGVRDNVEGVLTTSMAPSGKLLAVGGTTGLQIFHFNGADPATIDTGALTTSEIDQVFWDNANHLYAISKPAGKLFVFTITPTSAKQAPGSPYSIPKPVGLTVQARGLTCLTPSSPGVMICSPVSGATVASPVEVRATARVTGTIARMELWVDGVKKYSESGNTVLNTNVSVPAGTHRFAVLAINTAGNKWQQAVNATVK